jgi:hypothetical protein
LKFNTSFVLLLEGEGPNAAGLARPSTRSQLAQGRTELLAFAAVVTRIAGVSFETMSRAILPWLIPLLVVLLAISIWPPLTLWLPSVLTGK